MKTLCDKVIGFSREGNIKGIQDLVDEVNVKELCSCIRDIMKQTEGPLLLNYLWKGFSDTGPSSMKRLQATEFILDEIHQRCIKSQQAADIVAVLIVELDKYPPAHLTKIYDLCMEHMQKNSPSGSSFWKDILTKVITTLSTKDNINYAGSDMPGSEFKEMTVEKLCRTNWKGDNIASVVSLFIGLALDDKQLTYVVVKVGKWLQDLKAPEVPPLSHQLFTLFHKSSSCTLTVFLHLCEYFSKHLYCREKQNASSREDSESIFSELDSDSYGPNSISEMRLAEGTVLYHVEEAARVGSPLVHNLLSSLKGIINTPELVINPFLITVLLHLVSTNMYQNQVLDILWSVIKCYIECDEERHESAWLRELVPLKFQLDTVLKSVIENCASGRDRVASGVLSLGIKLLSIAPPIGYTPPSHNAEILNPDGWVRQSCNLRERLVERAWHLGSGLLLLLAKRVNSMATPVLKTVLSSIIAGQSVTTMAHLSGCLAKMSLGMPLMMLENQSILIEKVNSVMVIGDSISDEEEEVLSVRQEVVDAILPLVKVSSYIRDSLILIMRKSMFSRSLKSREVAVKGFLHMLKYLKAEELSALSQSSQRLPSSISQNPDLGPQILEFLCYHLSQFLVDLEKNIGDQLTSPFIWSKIVVINGKDACLKEPIASLIWCTQLVFLSGSESDQAWPNENIALLSKVKKIMKALVLQVGRCVPSDYGLEETQDFSVASAETEEKKLIIQQLFGLHEALISYVIGSWRKHVNEPGESLISLMNAYSRLEVFVSRVKLADAEVKGRKKKDKENGDTQKKQVGNPKSPSQLIPEPILDSKCTYKFLKILFNDLPEIDMESVSNKVRQSLHTFGLKAALHHIRKERRRNFYHRQRFTAVKPCYDITCIIYKNCIAKLLEYGTFHKNSALMALECLCETVALDAKYHKLASILNEQGILGDVEVENDESTPLKKFITMLESLLDDLIAKDENEEEVEKDAWFNMPFLVLSCIVCLSSQLLPSNEIPPGVVKNHPAEKLLDWFNKFSKEKNPKNPKVAKLALVHTFVLGNRCHYSVLELPFMRVIKQLKSDAIFGSLDENEEESLEFKVITDATKAFAFSLLCQKLKLILEETDRMLKRLKSESYKLQTLNEPITGNASEMLNSLEKEVCTKLIHCSQIVNEITKIATPAGPLHPTLLKLIVDVYNSVAGITRYFIQRSGSKTARPVFEGTRYQKLVQLVGGSLSSNVCKFRTHMQECIESAESKKKGVKSQNPAAMKSSSLLVYSAEVFERLIIQLSKKTKENLSALVKLTISRDFRIDQQKLEENLKSLHNEDRNEDEDEVEDEIENDSEEDQENKPTVKRPRLEH
ncbi:hypothetical protein J437_LFUL001092 [Ladona fulva]|uniref:Fanconi anemia group I protein n=1 Tax=Ladona fulva TaxID=123851 RepID=A0A8K0NTF2_LADFU|nr:hypothetical protein J437_LFUL001092 [Ladona fulva]